MNKPKSMHMPASAPDIAIVGGGLAGVLHAVALRDLMPDIRVTVFEGGDTLGGNHRWSFFGSDVSRGASVLLRDLAIASWPRNEVAFPGHSRVLETRYNSFCSADFDRWARARLPPESLALETRVASMDHQGVTLDDGTAIQAGLVLDARGPHSIAGMECGWQKFMGLELLMPGHGVAHPTIMDARVSQIDGYRFVYVLPLDADRLFIEDTYYADTPDFSAPDLKQRILDYAANIGHVEKILHTETGALPIVISGDPETVWPQGDMVPRIGMHGGMFHHTTGYCLPWAVQGALDFAAAWQSGGARDASWFRGRFLRHWQAQGYFRLLNTMVFRAAAAEKRYCTFEHFYRLPRGLIERFYSGRLTWADKLRVLTGKPPVPVSAAIRALLGRNT